MTNYEEALVLELETADPHHKDWRKSRAYRLWRIVVIQRDKRCVICNSGKSRHAHHVNHSTYYPELRFDPDNGVTLCSGCHTNYHCQMNRSYRTKCDEYNFMNFVHLSCYMLGIWPSTMLTDAIPISTAKATMPNTVTLSRHHERMLVAYRSNRDSVVAYVNELARMRTDDEQRRL